MGTLCYMMTPLNIILYNTRHLPQVANLFLLKKYRQLLNKLIFSNNRYFASTYISSSLKLQTNRSYIVSKPPTRIPVALCFLYVIPIYNTAEWKSLLYYYNIKIYNVQQLYRHIIGTRPTIIHLSSPKNLIVPMYELYTFSFIMISLFFLQEVRNILKQTRLNNNRYYRIVFPLKH